MTDADKTERPQSGVKRCFCILGKCVGCKQVHACAHLLWQVVKGVAILLFFLWAFGLPGGWVADKINPYLAPYRINIQRVTWSPIHGLIVHNPEVSESKLGSVPILTADSFFIRPNYNMLLKKKWETRNVGIKYGRALFPISHTNSGITIIDYMDLHDIEGNIDYDGKTTRIDVTATSDIGTRCSITGTFLQSRAVDEKKKTTPWIKQIHKAHASLYTTPRWIVAVRERIDQMVFDEAPELAINFQSDNTGRASTRGTLAFVSGPFQYRGVRYDRMEVGMSLANNLYSIEHARVERDENDFLLTGTYDRTNDVFDAHALNNLPMDSISVFFPERWQQRMTNQGLRFSGSMRSEGWIGPCGIREAPKNWSGWLSIDNAAANDLHIKHAFASVKREGHMLKIDDAILEGDEGPSAGTITFNTETDLLKKETTGRIDLGIDLKALRPFLPRGLKRLANELDSRDDAARFTGTFTLPHTNTESGVVNGLASGTNVSFRGVFMDECNTTVHYENSILQLDPFYADCQTGAVSGIFVFDLPSRIYGVDASITADPKRVAPAAGTNFMRGIKPFTFSDQVLLNVEGVVYPDTMKDTDLRIYLSGDNIGRTNLVSDLLQRSGTFYNDRLIITNMLVDAFDGSITGVLNMVINEMKTNFVFSGAATNLSIDRVIKTFRPGHTNQYEGRLDSYVHIGGPFPDKPGRTNITGSGGVEIRDGQLMRIPVFGGLSKLLSKIYPGLGFAEQNQLTGTFKISDGNIRTKDMKLLGSVISFSAKGTYHFRDHLDFDIQVKPLRKGIIASTIRIVTIPISKLLEFNVSGPLKEPKWEAANIPLL